MHLAPLDWIVIALSIVLTFWIGARYTRRAGQSVDEYFLSGRTLPWWLAGTSMVATSFAADTPLLISGLVRDGGIWRNWTWWCYALSGMFATFLFARWWRRGGVMTKAELVELRYGGPQARVLRGTLGVLHAGWTNTIILCWVLLAAVKIMDVLFGVDKYWALAISCSVAVLYSTLSGLWGVVVTDVFQFALAMAGSIALAVLAWSAAGGSDGILLAAAQGAPFTSDTLRFLPAPGPGGFTDLSFWTVPMATIAVYLGVGWWAVENVDGASAAVQRICASKDERHGLLATLWFNVAHYALRPWPWIMVGLASLVLVPSIEVHAPVAGLVVAASADEIVLEPAGSPKITVPLHAGDETREWRAQLQKDVTVGKAVQTDQLLARTDPERAYVVMMVRYLPVGLLGLVIASLLAAFMSTVDTHINLAASFFVNDVYRRFLKRDESARHYVLVARLASLGVMAVAGAFALRAESIKELFLFFIAFLSGVGPVYVLRWLWWRVRASTELTAMLSSAGATLLLSFADFDWPAGPLTPGGELGAEARLLLVVGFSLLCSLASMALTAAPDPASLVPFYRRVRPWGAWGPVAALAPDVIRPPEVLAVTAGVAGGLAATLGLMFAIGFALLQRPGDAALAGAVAAAGACAVAFALRRLPRG
jgi:solute:Na+ symporter, SSS family